MLNIPKEHIELMISCLYTAAVTQLWSSAMEVKIPLTWGAVGGGISD